MDSTNETTSGTRRRKKHTFSKLLQVRIEPEHLKRLKVVAQMKELSLSAYARERLKL